MLGTFSYRNATKLYFGEDSLQGLNEELPKYGKTVVPFCTSGGSGLGESAANLQKLAPGAKVLPGKRFASSVSADELRKWAEQF